jgi:hypothetical protein
MVVLKAHLLVLQTCNQAMAGHKTVAQPIAAE